MTRSAGPVKGRYVWLVIVKIFLDLVVPVAGYDFLRGAGFGRLSALDIAVLPAIGHCLYRITRGRTLDACETFVLLILASVGRRLVRRSATGHDRRIHGVLPGGAG
jgi:hypothetical protein